MKPVETTTWSVSSPQKNRMLGPAIFIPTENPLHKLVAHFPQYIVPGGYVVLRAHVEKNAKLVQQLKDLQNLTAEQCTVMISQERVSLIL